MELLLRVPLRIVRVIYSPSLFQKCVPKAELAKQTSLKKCLNCRCFQVSHKVTEVPQFENHCCKICITGSSFTKPSHPFNVKNTGKRLENNFCNNSTDCFVSSLQKKVLMKKKNVAQASQSVQVLRVNEKAPYIRNLGKFGLRETFLRKATLNRRDLIIILYCLYFERHIALFNWTLHCCHEYF